jgi:Fe-S-cluster-containing dehydrogenase component/anaerobic selenocysteine-containing dehydrogenase
MPMDAPEQPITFHAAVPGAITRRRAVAWMAASAALASAGCTPSRESIHPWVRMPQARGGTDALYFASAVLREGHAQGVLVGTQQGRPIKIEGNPAHPSSLGATDVFAQAAVLQLWDPDRSQSVLQRLGRTDGTARAPSVPASWSAFETAWRGEARRLRASGGAGLRLLTGPVTSPTLRAQIAQWLQALPKARWHQHAPLRATQAEAGAIAAFGRSVQVVPHLERASCVVALAGDPFSDGPACVRVAQDWAAQRRSGSAAVLLAAEVTPGLFGARSDQRIALAPARIDALVQRVAARLLQAAQPSPVADPLEARFEAELVAALQRAGAGSLLLPGDCLAPATHAAVHAIHAKLGARTLDLLPPLAFADEAGTVAQLAGDMAAGAVDTLVLLDTNPAYDAPGPLAFGAALRKVRLTVHAGLYRDETARACDWHLPLAHTFEQWSDARAHDGTATLLQPAIEPLYEGRSAHELLALLAGDDERNGQRIVQRSWRAQWGGDFDARWRESLRSGLIAGSAVTPLALPAPKFAAAPPAAPAAAAELVAVFAPDPSTLDGSYANNAWLQELPRPFTKLTWDNALLLGPGTAARLGVARGDHVRVQVGAGHVQGPVWIEPLHAEGAVTLPLGYGRRAAGRVGNAVGFDVYPLRPPAGSVQPVQLERAGGGQHAFALAQREMDPSDREPARSVKPGERASPPAPATASLYPPHPDGEHAWAMAIDLDACIGCNACTIACQAENNIPVVGPEQVSHGRVMHWIRVDRYDSPDPGGSIFQPVPCMHCEQAPCELVCPVGATMHDSEGLNVQVYNRCIGTRFCSNNCPYKVRRFNFLQFTDAVTESLKGQRNPEVTVRQRGVMEKCSYCIQRIARGRQHAQATGVPLADGDVVTACQAVCPTQAIHFGDLRLPGSAVGRLRESPRHYVLLEELNTHPRTTYLARVRPGPAA